MRFSRQIKTSASCEVGVAKTTGVVFALMMIFSLLAVSVLTLSGCSAEQPKGIDVDLTRTTDNATASLFSLELNLYSDLDPQLSQYDVDVYVDGAKVGTVVRGTSGKYADQLTAGTHELALFAVGAEAAVGLQTFEMPAESAVLSCSFTAEASKIGIKYCEVLTAVQNGTPALTQVNNLAVPQAAQRYQGQSTTAVEASLLGAGFTNIIMEPVYDLENVGDDQHKSQLNTVASMTINGNGAFEAGEAFPANADVRIKYHLAKSDDPRLK